MDVRLPGSFAAQKDHGSAFGAALTGATPKTRSCTERRSDHPILLNVARSVPSTPSTDARIISLPRSSGVSLPFSRRKTGILTFLVKAPFHPRDERA